MDYTIYTVNGAQLLYILSVAYNIVYYINWFK